MNKLPRLGALNKLTNEYVLPSIANKQDEHICPDCSKDLILKKGTKRVHHFAHYGGINPIGFEAIKIIEKNIKQYIDKMEVSNYMNSITDGYTVVYPENTHI